MKAKEFDSKFDEDIDITAELDLDKATHVQREQKRGKTSQLDNAEAARRKRLGLMAGRLDVPDDFDRMGSDEIEQLFNGET